MSPAPQFDELIHAPTRLSIVALLAASEWAEFTFVQDSLGMSGSALSKQIATLEDAGYVTVRKTGAGRTCSSWCRRPPWRAATRRQPGARG